MDFGTFLQNRRGGTQPITPMPRKTVPLPGGYQEALLQREQAQQKPIAQRFAEFQAQRQAVRR